MSQRVAVAEARRVDWFVQTKKNSSMQGSTGCTPSQRRRIHYWRCLQLQGRGAGRVQPLYPSLCDHLRSFDHHQHRHHRDPSPVRARTFPHHNNRIDHPTIQLSDHSSSLLVAVRYLGLVCLSCLLCTTIALSEYLGTKYSLLIMPLGKSMSCSCSTSCILRVALVDESNLTRCTVTSRYFTTPPLRLFNVRQ